MKKFLIVLAFLLLAGAGYFTYDKWMKDADLSLWSFMPANTALVYESSAPLQAFAEIQETDIWKNLEFISDFKRLQTQLDLLDSLAGKGNFTSFFNQNQALIGLNVTSSQSFDFLYVVEIQNLSQQTYISKAQAYFGDKGYKRKTREYEGFTITELIGPLGGEVFTYIFYKNYFIGSFSAFLVEDAIRTVAGDPSQNFYARTAELHPLTKLEKDQGNLYLNLERIESIVGMFLKQPLKLNPGKSAFLDLKVSNDYLNLNGFSFTSSSTHFLKNFSNSAGARFDMAEIIPNETSWLQHFGSRNTEQLGQSLNAYLSANEPDAMKLKQQIKSANDFDVDYTYQLVDEEICLVHLESGATGATHKLLLLEISDMGEALSFFNSAGERDMLKTGDTLYSEPYGAYEIRKLPFSDYPKALLGTMGEGFEHCYYLQYRNYLVFCNNLQQLKNFTISIANEATWTKSIRINRFLEQTNREANYSLMVNIPRAWSALTAQMKPSWKAFFEEHQLSFKNLEFAAVQFSAVDNKFYTNTTIYQPELPKRTIPERITTKESIVLPDYIITKPWLVTNHDTRQRETLLQDTSGTVYLIDAEFNVLWDKKINGSITSDIRQIDYYNNGKLQYLFTTQNQVHIIDRTGTYIPEFPRGLPKNQGLSDLQLIDYDKSKKYRFGIANKDGKIYLTDKNVKPLKGWDPLDIGGNALVSAPIHRRIGRKDILITATRSGQVTLLNRRGDDYKGFPVKLESTLTKPFFIKTGNSFEESSLVLLTTNGELVEISFTGQLLRREQLYKPVARTMFRIVPDVTGDTYLILRRTESSYEMLDTEGNVLFKKDYFTDRPLYTQYYQLGAGKEFIVFTDPGGTYLYLYDRNGNLLTGRPLTSSQPISIMQYENELHIYKVVDRNLELVTVAF
ncbi:hypothetical protein [Marinoscillum furvescens]|uniref:DUF3352 domain-containing protein n=1 Tax=Marinoscillum furvescens DSM 4134 TaxID=1122208 RepID=A0A3D9KX13_MARFU|nr:hypothetical protein [Marinoscillum furvescens]RED93180.1 hypothetical protein C7460_12619 [Marinoscillum furvescens DSM 4134]